ncbi:MAG: HlyD family efflux transporter periplasmic adaptor subunit [Gemmatimonadaceae bacterium]
MSIVKTYASSNSMYVLLSFALLITACKKEAPPDSYGNFEAEETVVAAETAGQLREFLPIEGQALTADSRVGQVDTIQLALERDQLLAQRAGILDHRKEVTQQIRALEVQLDIAKRAKERTDRLFAQQAAPAVQRDQQERDVRVLTEQIAGTRVGIARVASDVAALDVRVAAVNDRARRATIVSPISGTVLATYVRTGEFIQPGQQLYRVANLDTLTLRAYVTGAQLAQFRIGQTVQVHVDGLDKTLRSYTGTITWVSSRAEFTPTPVQTRDDRGDLVYAVKVRVANADGALKIGMPADMSLGGPVANTTPAPGHD